MKAIGVPTKQMDETESDQPPTESLSLTPEPLKNRKASMQIPDEPRESVVGVIDRELGGLINMRTRYLLKKAVDLAPDYHDYRQDVMEGAMDIAERSGVVARWLSAKSFYNSVRKRAYELKDQQQRDS